MTINFSQIFKNMNGEALKEGDKIMTLSTVSVNVLLGTFQNDQPSPEDKVKRWKLAQRLYEAKDANLVAEDVVLLKKLIGLAYGPLIVGQSFEILENERSAPRSIAEVRDSERSVKEY